MKCNKIQENENLSELSYLSLEVRSFIMLVFKMIFLSKIQIFENQDVK